MSNQLPHSILLAGNPNSGKTTLFNLLTGLRHKTANYPGVTVETRSGTVKMYNSSSGGFDQLPCIDLPGVYSLVPDSADEEAAVKAIQGQLPHAAGSVLLYVADTTNLPRSLDLFFQLRELGFRMLFILNMADLAARSGIVTDTAALEQWLQCPVLSINSRGGTALKQIKDAIRNSSALPQHAPPTPDASEISAHVAAYWKRPRFNPAAFLQKADVYLMHPVWGILIFMLLMSLVFQAVFAWASYPMEWIETGMAALSSFIAGQLPPGVFTDLLTEGILAGVSGVLVFIPQIAFLFLFVAIMEESGYMARVSFLFDRFMRRFGLNGRSTIALIGGAACAVPSILSARTISNRKERLITIFVTPLMSCSARLPVYTVLIALVVPDQRYFIFNLQGMVLMGLYVAGIASALGTAWLLNLLFPGKETGFLMMELPFYKRPHWTGVFDTVRSKVMTFVLDAGKIIVAISIVLWVLASYGPAARMNDIEKRYAALEQSEENKNRKAAEKLENSYAGIMGKKLEPAIRPLGFDWKIGIALITSFAAREVFVGTMSTLYSVGSEDEARLTEKLHEQKRADGTPVFTLGVSVALMLFYAFAMQCMSTFAVVKRETQSWRIPAAQFVYMALLAWISAFIAYILLS